MKSLDWKTLRKIITIPLMTYAIGTAMGCATTQRVPESELLKMPETARVERLRDKNVTEHVPQIPKNLENTLVLPKKLANEHNAGVAQIKAKRRTALDMYKRCGIAEPGSWVDGWTDVEVLYQSKKKVLSFNAVNPIISDDMLKSISEMNSLFDGTVYPTFWEPNTLTKDAGIRNLYNFGKDKKPTTAVSISKSSKFGKTIYHVTIDFDAKEDVYETKQSNGLDKIVLDSAIGAGSGAIASGANGAAAGAIFGTTAGVVSEGIGNFVNSDPSTNAHINAPSYNEQIIDKKFSSTRKAYRAVGDATRISPYHETDRLVVIPYEGGVGMLQLSENVESVKRDGSSVSFVTDVREPGYWKGVFGKIIQHGAGALMLQVGTDYEIRDNCDNKSKYYNAKPHIGGGEETTPGVTN